jgi:hypothetical protein
MEVVEWGVGMEMVEWGVGIVWFGDCGMGFGWGEGGVERCGHSSCAFGEWASILRGRFRDAFVLIRQVTLSVRVCFVLSSGVPLVIWDYIAVWEGCVVYANSFDGPRPPSGSSASIIVDCGKSQCLCGSCHSREMVPVPPSQVYATMTAVVELVLFRSASHLRPTV